MPNPSVADTPVFDAAGVALDVLGLDGAQVRLGWPDGTALTVPIALLEVREDGTLLLPLARDGDDENAALRVPVLEERLRLGKRVVEREGVRISKRVHAHQEQVTVALAEETLEIERVPLDREVREDALPQMREEGDTVVIPVLEERLVVRKQIVLKEELRVTRRRGERMRTLTETLRSEQVEVERVQRTGRNE